MRYSRIPAETVDSVSETTGTRLVVETEDGTFDLTSVKSDLRAYDDLAQAAIISDRSVGEIATMLAEEATEVDEDVLEGSRLLPLIPDEVWAAGVTYQISEEAREEESESSDVYMKVYDAERPEIFFKATPSRLAGPNEAVGVREDSGWDVPEPEIGIVLHRDEVVGFTLGNDVSSRSIEGENPLYLPQAKVYDRACSIGPSVVTTESGFDPENTTMTMRILRDGEQVFEGSASTNEMVRSFDELVEYYAKGGATPEWGVLLTGTTLVPPDEFTLTPGDRVEITVEDIGTLVNKVTEV